jgi:predicted CopG family antitoxin
MSQKTITLPDEVYERVQRQAQTEGKTVDELAAEFVQKELALAALDRLSRKAVLARGNMTDEQVEEIVDRAVRESRQEHRGR